LSETILAALIAGATSSGLCSLVIFLIQRRDKKKGKRSAETEMLLGLGHDRIVYLGGVYVGRGYITQDEYENLHEYLFKPYERLGGNGTASRVMREVEKLPLRK
jgi:hypothetical protein